MHGTVSVPSPTWFQDWSGEVCAIIASGQSAKQQDIEILRGKCRVVIINNNHELAPWADILYAADERWWQNYPAALKFPGLKLTTSEPAARAHKLNTVQMSDAGGHEEKSRFSFDRNGYVARGGNSAFQVVNLVAQFKCRRQIWIGFDFHGDHWHEKHPGTMKNPRPHTLARWAKTLDAQAWLLQEMGVEVANCSPTSALTAYPKTTLREVAERWLS